MMSLLSLRKKKLPPAIEPVASAFPLLRDAEIAAAFAGQRSAGDFYDSFRVSPDALKECRDVIAQRFGEKYLPEKPNFYSSRSGAQEAHECIRPTHVEMAPESLRGRVIATMICVTVAAAPAGGLAGGWLAEHLGLRSAIFFAGAGAMLLVLVVAWTSPLLRLRSLEEVQPRRVESVAEEMAG